MTHRNNLCDFSYVCLLFACIEFIGPVDSMNKSFQDPKNSVSDCVQIANNAMTVLKQSRTDDAFDRFYAVALRYCDMYDCVTKPEVLTDIQRRRQRRNCKDLLNYFVVEGYEGKDVGEKYCQCKSVRLGPYALSLPAHCLSADCGWPGKREVSRQIKKNLTLLGSN